MTEEEHTSGLLFPDASLLHGSKTHAYPLQTSGGSAPNASAAGSYDDRGALDVDAGRDFRVLIAQNAIGDRDDPCVLLDTQAMSQADAAGHVTFGNQLSGRGGRHSRHSTMSRAQSKLSARGSQSYIPDFDGSIPPADTRKKDLPNSSAFVRARNRRSTFSATSSSGYSESSSLGADANELGLLNCVFGSSAFSYRGSSTKMHILPGGGEPPREVDDHVPHGTRRRSPLYRSTDNSPRTQASNSFGRGPPHLSEPKSQATKKVAVLVTRMFSVNLPETRDLSTEQLGQPCFPGAESFQDGEGPPFETAKRKKIKEKKTPMYAVAMVIQLPLATNPIGRSSPRYAAGADASKQSTCLSVSLDSGQRTNSSFLEEQFGSSPTDANLDDRIDTLVDHWDIINRTLSHIEKIASREILVRLQQADSSSGRYPKPAKPPNMQRTNQKIVQLASGSLFENATLREEVLRAAHRVCMALRIPRVITGQSRWGIWREEARWIARYLNDKEHNFFFLVLITAFLGNHTEWLNLLGPDWYRRRHHLQQKAQSDSELIMSNRTVIISSDKMIARRLVFVLSAFLPAQQRSEGLASPLRPSTSASGHPYSMSPPNVPVSRRESLRRTINKQSRASRHKDEADGLKRSASVASNEATGVASSDDTLSKSYSPQGRRSSDARSIRTANLPIPQNDARSRKTVTSTVSTAAQGTTTPVPHFASQRAQPREKESDSHGFENNPSAASVNLLQQLQRSESSETNPDGGNPHSYQGLGSFFSGFWGPRASSSTERRDQAPAGDVQARRSSVVPLLENRRRPVTTPNETRNLVAADAPPSKVETSDLASPESPSILPHALDTAKINDTTEDKRLESPVKLSVEANDGVVDVELPLPGFFSLSSSGDSTLTSPKKTRTSVTSVDSGASIHSGNPYHSSSQKDGDGLTVNVSGWLKRYHDDFLLQAVCPYDGVETDIKRSMSAEPTPNQVGESTADKWVDVCTTLIADTTTSTVKRLRLRRKIPAGYSRQRDSSQDASSPSSPYNSLLTTQISDDGSEPANFEQSFLKEDLVEEPVMDLDPTLVDAVERVIAHSGPPSSIHSRAASPNRLRRGRSGLSEASDSQKSDIRSAEVPRKECKRTVLGALEEVVRSVAAERQEDPNSGQTFSGPGHTASGAFADNALKEGVRKWLLDIEEAC